MKLYAILRRNAWDSSDALAGADARSRAARSGRDDLRHVRSYVLAESGGGIGTICFYEAETPEAIVAHARTADLPADEVVEVTDVALGVPDPVPVGRG